MQEISQVEKRLAYNLAMGTVKAYLKTFYGVDYDPKYKGSFCSKAYMEWCVATKFGATEEDVEIHLSRHPEEIIDALVSTYKYEVEGIDAVLKKKWFNSEVTCMLYDNVAATANRLFASTICAALNLL